MLRAALYSGSWYPSDRKGIERYASSTEHKQRALAAVCPHAGWAYSGKTAGKVFSALEPAELYIVIGPNHRAEGSSVSVYTEGAWQTPLGDLEIDEKAASSILDISRFAKADPLAHSKEHSLEVQMPFIKLFSPKARIVPICMYDYSREACADLGDAVSKAVTVRGVSSLIVASTDMSHYVPAGRAKEADAQALDRIMNLDWEGLLSVVEKKGISMCGAGPVAAAIRAAKTLGASSAVLSSYTTSREVTGEDEEVVAYAGVIIK